MRAVIVGGGIAGPATAMALRAVGIDSLVVDANPADRGEVGSWFTVAANGVAALAAIDALEQVRGLGVPTDRNVMVSASGRTLGTVPLGSARPDGTVALSFHRTRLAAALTDLARRRGIEVRTGARVTGAATGDRGARVTLDSGEVIAGDLVIGADGINSVVRAAVDPRAPERRYTGLANFGGVTEHTPLAAALDPGAWRLVFGRRAFFGALPTPSGDVVWFANVPRPPVSRQERAGTPLEAWRRTLVDLAAADAGPFRDLIAAGRLDLAGDNTFDLPHVPVWHRGRLGLVGDAIHAPAPSSGQGASMALEDAVVLASCLHAAATPEAAFAAFEGRRRERVEGIVAEGARSSGFKTAGPVGRVIRDAVLRAVFHRIAARRTQAWITDHRVALPGLQADRPA
ncbi:2-polyprenyl-6-methoxyphenol hydroxylase-like FAD-dependent oxidoreductase [Streptomonospora nanhaiensis]|uniref:2-polyprenyl-6-methoxyphenol hydroxylase-like FAD-dependent oxidoreductase n=1 Tax=Streptomonospora nanhaiensis TaxID=1323731 RepID=A0A853BRG0_9ACTN|nr:NAD(P)/FAD-dependent oxidoreductase [Streptomonospora nanhaiensis]NYI98329.1 2-polyprenyl-6-methoxyphenol hydroxylase-like FAD-dependent oxidoreductase [Streptomonospora nanhaiensis]